MNHTFLETHDQFKWENLDREIQTGIQQVLLRPLCILPRSLISCILSKQVVQTALRRWVRLSRLVC